MIVTRGVIEVLMMSEVDLGLNIPATINLAICKKLFKAIGYVYICPRPDNFPPITRVTMVHCCVYMLILVVSMIVFMKM